MRITKSKEISYRVGYDRYQVSFDSFNKHPVVYLSDTVTLYTRYHIDRLLWVLLTLNVLDDVDFEMFFKHAKDLNAKVELCKGISRVQPYIRVKTNANSHSCNK